MARHSSLCLALLLQLFVLREEWPNVAAFVPNPVPAAFVASRTTTTTSTTTTITSLFAGDGNPPPFGDWGAPVASTPPRPPTAATLPTTTYSSPLAPASAGSVSSVTAGMEEADPIALLQASQNTLVQQIQAALPDLVFKSGASGTEDAILGPGSFLQAYDAPGAANVAWLASVYVPQRLSSLTIFNGPLTDVPHILSRCCCSVDPPNQQRLEVAIDIRPRAYGAYELQDPVTGEYPGPEQLGRKAFEYSGARQEYFQKFATDAIRQLLDPTQFEQATPLPQSDLDLVTGGPWALHLQMPATRHNVQRILHVRQGIGEAWLEWNAQTNHQHRPGAPVNTQYVYDSKFRQNCYLALLPYYQRVFPANDGAALAAAESGPLDEGYVGGGS